jgi:hypothetical protein
MEVDTIECISGDHNIDCCVIVVEKICQKKERVVPVVLWQDKSLVAGNESKQPQLPGMVPWVGI